MRLAPFSLIAALAFTALSAHGQAPAAAAATQEVRCTPLPTTHTPADKAFAAGDNAAAERLFVTQIATAPTDADYNGLVHAQLEQDKLPEALASAQKAVAAFPRSADALADLGDVQFRSGKPYEAYDTFAKAVRLDPCNAHAHFGIARIYELTSHHSGATRQLTQARHLAPSDPAILAAYLETMPGEKRLPSLKALLAAHPALPRTELDRLSAEAAILEQHLTCQPSAAFATAKLPMSPLRSTGDSIEGYGFKLLVNDAALPLAQLDTTVDGIVLTEADAAKANVRPLAGVARSVEGTYKAVADQIKIGDLVWTQCPVTVAPETMIGHRNSIVGASFFRDHLIHLEYHRGAASLTNKLQTLASMTLSPLPAMPAAESAEAFVAPDEKTWTHIFVAGAKILVPTVINNKGSYLFALDNGVLPSVITPSVARVYSDGRSVKLPFTGYSGSLIRLLLQTQVTNTTEVKLLAPGGGSIPVGIPSDSKLPTLQFGGFKLENRQTLSFDLTPFSHDSKIEITGLFGDSDFHEFITLDLNYRDGLMKLVLQPV